MSTCALSWSEIRPDLVAGSCPIEPDDLGRIRDRASATAVLSLQSDECLRHVGIDYAGHCRYGERLGLAMRRAPMRDFDVEDQRYRLAPAVRALARFLSAGHRVYVHCTAGVGRSPLVLVAYLTLIEALPESEAFALVQSRRPGAAPSRQALAACRTDLLRTHRGDIEMRAWHRYRARAAAGRTGSADADWLAAEREVLRGVLTAKRPLP